LVAVLALMVAAFVVQALSSIFVLDVSGLGR
jgi:hypothetical protein